MIFFVFATTVLIRYMYNVVCLTRAGVLPWRFSIYCEMSKETISNSRRRIRFLLFFSFSACPKAGGWCRSTQCRTGASAYQRLQVQPRPLKVQSTSAIDQPHLHACTYCLGDRKTTRNTFYWRFDSASTSAQMCFLFYLFIYFCYCC